MRAVIHGAGPSGCVAARLLAEAGYDVLVMEKRYHIGGNTYDNLINGVLVHMYGPHLFHTNDLSVVKFLSRFTKWKDYKHKVKAVTEEGIIGLPIYDKQLTEDVSVTEHYADPYYYNLVYKDYSFKQWGYQPPKEVLDRVMIKHKPQSGYFTDAFQALPQNGYTALFEAMLDHPKITVELNIVGDERPECDLRVWTGKVDEYFGYTLGTLPYRSLNFNLTLQPKQQEAVTVNNCTNKVKYTRVTNYGMMHDIDKNVCQTEYPTDHIIGSNEPYYPMGDNPYDGVVPMNENCILIGRLAEYKYYDMDKAISNAMKRIKDVIK